MGCQETRDHSLPLTQSEIDQKPWYAPGQVMHFETSQVAD